MKYRIIKRTNVLYEDKIPRRICWYVIQRKIKTIFLLWIPIWMDMKFDDYGDSIMCFDTFKEAEDYVKKIKEINNENRKHPNR